MIFLFFNIIKFLIVVFCRLFVIVLEVLFFLFSNKLFNCIGRFLVFFG